MPRTKDTDFFVKKLPELGGNSGNKTLRENLGWQDAKYFNVRGALIEEGLVEIGRGRGGSVYLLEDSPNEEVGSAGNSSEALEFESHHYNDVVKKLEKQLKQDFQHAVIELTAHRGRKSGGKWSHPDILALTVQRFEYVVHDEFILRSYEIKRSDRVDTDAVSEAAAHQRLAQLAYLVVVPHGDGRSIFDPTNIKRRRIEQECLKSGVGLILIPDYHPDSEIELAIETGVAKIDYRDVNSTIGRLFSEDKRKEIKKLINVSRLGELRKLI